MNRLLNRVAVLTLALVLNGGQQQPSAIPRSGAQLRNLAHDPKIADSSSTPSPIPSDTPYSKWAVNGSSYLVAYRNADKGDPNDIVADIYFKNSQDSGLRKIISVPVFSQASDRAISAQNQALIVVGLLVDSQVFRKASIGLQPLDGSGVFFGYQHY